MIKVLVVGIGNPLRGDDGAGAAVVERITQLNWPVTTMVMPQLQIEFLEDALEFDRMVIVDACINEKEVIVQKAFSGQSSGPSSSHHLGVSVFLSLAKTIYQKDLDLYVCSIPAENFEVGASFSNLTTQGINRALERIKSVIDDKEMNHA